MYFKELAQINHSQACEFASQVLGLRESLETDCEQGWIKSFGSNNSSLNPCLNFNWTFREVQEVWIDGLKNILHHEHFLTPFSGWRRIGNTIVNLFLANMKTESNRHLVRELDPMGHGDILRPKRLDGHQSSWVPIWTSLLRSSYHQLHILQDKSYF